MLGDELSGELRLAIEKLQEAQELLRSIANKGDCFFKARRSAEMAATHAELAITDAATALGLAQTYQS